MPKERIKKLKNNAIMTKSESAEWNNGKRYLPIVTADDCVCRHFINLY